MGRKETKPFLQSVLPLSPHLGVMEDCLSRALFTVKYWGDNRLGKARESETLQNIINKIYLPYSSVKIKY